MLYFGITIHGNEYFDALTRNQKDNRDKNPDRELKPLIIQVVSNYIECQIKPIAFHPQTVS